MYKSTLQWTFPTVYSSCRFDPLGLAAPKNYLQYDLDSLDLNKAVNAPGKFVSVIKEDAGNASATTLQPYKDAFGLARFRENELIHGRCASQSRMAESTEPLQLLLSVPSFRHDFPIHQQQAFEYTKLWP